MSNTSNIAARSGLNRLIVACCDEITALNDGVRAITRIGRTPLLERQARRRVVFNRDLGVGVVALGGVAAHAPSHAAGLSSLLRNLKHALAGPHEGDAYAACANATAKTARAYSSTLALDLPSDVRFGLERQYAEIEYDRKELRRLRWGAAPSDTLERNLPEKSERENEATRRETADHLALEAWDDDGGSTRMASS